MNGVTINDGTTNDKEKGVAHGLPVVLLTSSDPLMKRNPKSSMELISNVATKDVVLFDNTQFWPSSWNKMLLQLALL